MRGAEGGFVRAFVGRRERVAYARAVREREATLLERFARANWRTGSLYERDGVRSLNEAFGVAGSGGAGVSFEHPWWLLAALVVAGLFALVLRHVQHRMTNRDFGILQYRVPLRNRCGRERGFRVRWHSHGLPAFSGWWRRSRARN